jgi:hypothetical protein
MKTFKNYTNGILFFLFLTIVQLQTNAEAATTPKKWFPGHYVYHDSDDYSTSNSDLTFLKNANGAVFQGMMMYVTWGQIETTKDTYRWDKIDAVLKALPKGKKLAVSLSWQGWGKLQTCPSDMLDNIDYDGGQHISGKGFPFATVYMTSTMNRYLAFVKKFAERYDTVPNLAFVTTAEIPFGTDVRGPLFNEATARTNYYRLPNEMIGYFKNTICGILGAWWSFGDNANAEPKFAADTYNAGGGFGFPDVMCLTCSQYNSNFRNEVLANAGKWPCWMGVEWSDLLPEWAGTTFPQDIIESASRNKTNFIWWLRTNRIAAGGYDFTTQALPYLKANPTAGISTDCPDNIDCLGTTASLNIKEESVKISPNPVNNILQIDGDIQNADVSIVHINGSIYYNQNQVNEKLMVNVDAFPSGMYFIKIGKNQRTIVRKFIKV